MFHDHCGKIGRGREAKVKRKKTTPVHERGFPRNSSSLSC